MARTVSQIQQQLLENIAADSTLGPLLTSTSKRAIYRLLCFIVATAVAGLEQLQDVYTTYIESVAARSAAASILWIQSKMFEFQYSSTSPQVIQLINTVPQYPVVDTNLRIITACSVSSTTSNSVVIKVAKGSPLQALSTLERSAAQSYIDYIGVAGIKYDVVSLNPDKLYVQADIYYNGQYSSIIQAQTIATLNQFLQQLSLTNFDGSLKMTDLEACLRNANGVVDVVLKNVRGREDSVAFVNGIDLILNTAVQQRQWKTVAGYVIEENTPGKTFTDTLNFIPQ
jgi:hypothetical protein